MSDAHPSQGRLDEHVKFIAAIPPFDTAKKNFVHIAVTKDQ
jgi:hypothetical protein